MKNLRLVIIVLILSSCSGFKHSNFNRQKFTELKSQTTYTKNSELEIITEIAKNHAEPFQPEPTSDLTIDQTQTNHQTHFKLNQSDESIQAHMSILPEPSMRLKDSIPCDTIYLKSGEILICRIHTVTDNEITFEYCNESEKTFILSRDKVLSFSQFNDPMVETSTSLFRKSDTTETEDTRVFGNRRNFEKLNPLDQNQAILDFNRLFNVGLGIFVTSLIFLFGAIFLFEALFVAAALIFAMWILSFVALNKVRRINLCDKPKSLKTKVRLAKLVCGIGTAVCIVTIFGGIILFFLLLFRVI